MPLESAREIQLLRDNCHALEDALELVLLKTLGKAAILSLHLRQGEKSNLARSSQLAKHGTPPKEKVQMVFPPSQVGSANLQ